MRISTHEQLLSLLDDVVAGSSRGDRSAPASARWWSDLLRQEDHPLATRDPDECLLDWHERGLLADLRGARVLDVGCGNGRNTAWFVDQGAQVVGVDIAAPLLDAVRPSLPDGARLLTCDVLRDPLPDGPFDLLYDSGCYHHVAPHRRATYRERLLPLLAPGGRYGVVTLAAEVVPQPSDTAMLLDGDTAGGASFGADDLRAAFAPLEPVEVRRLRAASPGRFGADFLNGALFRAV